MNVVTCKMNESIGNQIGGTTAPLDMFIDFKVLSAKALLTCKTFSKQCGLHYGRSE